LERTAACLLVPSQILFFGPCPPRTSPHPGREGWSLPTSTQVLQCYADEGALLEASPPSLKSAGASGQMDGRTDVLKTGQCGSCGEAPSSPTPYFSHFYSLLLRSHFSWAVRNSNAWPPDSTVWLSVVLAALPTHTMV
jgi:hypothetical protein